MKLNEAKAGDKVSIYVDTNGLLATRGKTERSIPARVIFASPKCFVLGWGVNDTPSAEAGFPRFIVNTQKERGAIPADWQPPSDIAYAETCYSISSTECELLERKPQPERFTSTLKDAKPGDRVEVMLDAQRYLVSVCSRAVSSITATLLAKDTDGDCQLVFRPGEPLPKNTYPSEVMGGYVARKSGIGLHVPCVILPPEPKEEPKLANTLKDANLGDTITLEDGVSYVVIGIRDEAPYLAHSTRIQHKHEIILGRQTKDSEQDYDRNGLNYDGADYLEGHKSYPWGRQVSKEAPCTIIANAPVKRIEQPIKPAEVKQDAPNTVKDVFTQTLGDAKLGDRVLVKAWRDDSPAEEATIVAIRKEDDSYSSTVLLGWKEGDTAVHAYEGCWKHSLLKKDANYLPDIETAYTKFWSTDREERCNILTPAAESKPVEEAKPIEPCIASDAAQSSGQAPIKEELICYPALTGAELGDKVSVIRDGMAYTYVVMSVSADGKLVALGAAEQQHLTDSVNRDKTTADWWIKYYGHQYVENDYPTYTSSWKVEGLSLCGTIIEKGFHQAEQARLKAEQEAKAIGESIAVEQATEEPIESKPETKSALTTAMMIGGAALGGMICAMAKSNQTGIRAAEVELPLEEVIEAVQNSQTA